MTSATSPAVGEKRSACEYSNSNAPTSRNPRSMRFGSPWKSSGYRPTNVLP